MTSLCCAGFLTPLVILPPFPSYPGRSENKLNRKQWMEAANSEQIGIHSFLMNFCSWVWNWQSFLGKHRQQRALKIARLWKHEMRNGNNSPECQCLLCTSEVSVQCDVEQLVLPCICCILLGLKTNSETKLFATSALMPLMISGKAAELNAGGCW